MKNAQNASQIFHTKKARRVDKEVTRPVNMAVKLDRILFAGQGLVAINDVRGDIKSQDYGK